MCICQSGYTGQDCSTRIDICEANRPCKHGSTCFNLVDTIEASIYPKYSCKCAPGYTGVNCEIEQETTTTTTTTRGVRLLKNEIKTVPTTSTSSQNGLFVLDLNIDVDEFHRRKAQIIVEFERRFGILMIIKKDANTAKEMIYSYHPK